MQEIKEGQTIRSYRTGKQFTVVELTDNFVHFEGDDGSTNHVLPKSRLWYFYELVSTELEMESEEI